MELSKNNIMVSVCMTTYNHEKFIKQSIESVLNQKTTFDYEIILSNDASTDNTSNLILEILNSHPRSQIVKYYNQSINIGMHKNGEFVLKQCKGKYIAICEGDDFWVDPYKLETQVNYLELNSDCGLVHHDVNYYFEKNQILIYDYKKSKNIQTPNGKVTDFLILNNFINTLSVVFRKDLLIDFFNIPTDIRNQFLMTDYFMWLLFSTKFNFYYIPKTMATYRILESSASNSKIYDEKIKFLESYCDIKLYFIEYTTISKQKIEEYRNQEASIISIKNLEFKKSMKYSNKLKLHNIRNISIFLLSRIFYYLKFTRIIIKFL